MGLKTIKINRKTIVLQITENCNLACTYCYQHAKKRNAVREDLLKDIITKSFEEQNDFEELEFDFIGGEPLLFMPLIRNVCEWTWSEPRQKPYIFFATTNGIVLSEKDKEWFRIHREQFWLGISLDGTKEMHDTNRCGSYDKIDKNFFLSTWPDQYVKMTISPQTIAYFAEGVISLLELGFKVTANLAYGVDWSNESYADILACELRKLVDYYLEHKEIEPIMLLNMPLFKLGNTDPEKYCGAGTGMVAYDILGRIYPCQLFYGTTGPSVKGWEKIDFAKIHMQYYQNCSFKQLFNICPICLGMSYSYSGDKFQCDPHLCKLMQVFFKANAYFQSKLILKKRKESFKNHKAADMLRGIKIVHQLLK